MAYQAGDLILDSHYNGFVSSINNLWGEGSGDSGYGQSTTLSTVADGTTITATQWSNLLSRISSMASHQDSSITPITSPTVSDNIAAYAALAGNITTITNNRLNADAEGDADTEQKSNEGSWTTSITHEGLISFDSANALRYFFNAGGYVMCSYQRIGGASTTKNTTWSTLCTDSGFYRIKARSSGKVSGSGSPTINNTTTGFYDTGSSYQGTPLFQQFSPTSPYTLNKIEVTTRTVSTNGIQLRVIFTDGASDVWHSVTGTLTTFFTIVPPSTAVLTNTWGNYSFA